jgi:hypothetical protein
MKRALIALPAILTLLFANRANAETYDLECREVAVSWADGRAWMCQRNWNPPGSRISEEQRKTVNAVVLLTVVAPLSRRRQ